jgi:hypothetical protein
MRIYKVEYDTARNVPKFKGRFGTESQEGNGTSGVLVNCQSVSDATRSGGLELTSTMNVRSIAGTQKMCMPTFTCNHTA